MSNSGLGKSEQLISSLRPNLHNENGQIRTHRDRSDHANTSAFNVLLAKGGDKFEPLSLPHGTPKFMYQQLKNAGVNAGVTMPKSQSLLKDAVDRPHSLKNDKKQIMDRIHKKKQEEQKINHWFATNGENSMKVSNKLKMSMGVQKLL